MKKIKGYMVFPTDMESDYPFVDMMWNGARLPDIAFSEPDRMTLIRYCREIEDGMVVEVLITPLKKKK